MFNRIWCLEDKVKLVTQCLFELLVKELGARFIGDKDTDIGAFGGWRTPLGGCG